MKRHLISVLAVLALLATVRADEAKTEKPAEHAAIKASDKAALDAATGKQATVEGTVSEAAWSKSGKVMNIKFEGAEDSGFVAVVFQKNKDAFDKAFDGDAVKALTGAKVKVAGKIATYHDKPQIVLNKPDQLKVEGKEKGDDKPAEKSGDKPADSK